MEGVNSACRDGLGMVSIMETDMKTYRRDDLLIIITTCSFSSTPS